MDKEIQNQSASNGKGNAIHPQETGNGDFMLKDMKQQEFSNQSMHSMADETDFIFKDVDFDPKFTHFAKAFKKVNLVWKDISLHIGKKTILQKISGSVKSGEVCALMGPSGAGKSSLLNVLSGRVIASSKKKIEGVISVNGTKINPVDFRTNIAYVMQQDLLFATATAREALEFSAKLRLPLEISSDTKQVAAIVDDLLESLGLSQVQHTLIGSEMIRGLSGGEKKRVAIGVELITNPALLFLDEPTSGLDTFSSWKVVKILQALGKVNGSAILCTIHQPSSEIFAAFDKVMMLTKGRVMYNGSVSTLPDAFEKLGHPLPQRCNPADFLILLAQTKEEKVPSYNIDTLEDKDTTKAELERMVSADNQFSLANKRQRTAGSVTQAVLLAKREFLNLTRDYVALIIGIVISVVMNIIFGLLFLDVAERGQKDFLVSSLFGALTMVIASAMFGAAQGPLLTFPLERGIFLREYRTGTYGAFPYLLSKLLIELPRSLINPIFALLSCYWLIGFSANFFALLGCTWILTLAIASYTVLIGSAVANAEQAEQFSPLVLVPQLLFLGLFVPMSTVPNYISWAQYICVLKYAVNLASIVEFQDCEYDPAIEAEAPGFSANCTAMFERNDIDSEYIWRDILIMAIVFVGFRALALIILVFKARNFA